MSNRESHKRPDAFVEVPTLSFVNYDSYEKKIASMGSRNLLEYHEITKSRLEISEYCLKLLLDNFDNDVAFVAGLTGFLVQAKAALDSLCQEINLFYRLSIGLGRDYPTETEELTAPQNLLVLSRRNVVLTKLIVQELGATNPWFATFKLLHASEGVHGHSRRLMSAGISPHNLEVGETKIPEFCAESLSKINRITEQCYDLMR